jgi:RecJ-like exonuclease
MTDERRFLETLEFGIAVFQDLHPRLVYSLSHNDGDGLTASAIVCKTMASLKIPCIQHIYDRSKPWAEFFGIELAKNYGVDVVFISDLGAEEKQICDIFRERPDISVFILDHHKVSPSEAVEVYPDNIHSMNPTRFGYDGLREIAGSTLTYLFCKGTSQRATKLAWLPVVGMAGDTLKKPSEYQSFNRKVLDEAVAEDQVAEHDGLSLFGGMADKTLQGSFLHSILPFVPVISGDGDRAKELVAQAGVDPAKGVLDLSSEEVVSLSAVLGDFIAGNSVLITGRDGLFHHAFEFNLMLSIVGDHDSASALHFIDKKGPTKNETTAYFEYIDKLVGYLGQIATAGGIEGEYYRFYDFKDTPRQLISDIASYTSVNSLVGDAKLLIIAAQESETMEKMSFRCSPAFVASVKLGAGDIIARLKPEYGGQGGGHDLAAGWTLPVAEFTRFTQNLQEIDIIFDSI